MRALGLPLLEMDGFEADDIIGTLARSGAEAGFEVFMVTGDKDFMQLVTPEIGLLNPNDKTENGKELRLRQQYFLASASLQDALRQAPAIHQGDGVLTGGGLVWAHRHASTSVTLR